MKLTKQQKLEVFLKVLGYSPVTNNRSSKFKGFYKMKMVRPFPGATQQMQLTTYWLGKSGAFRRGRTISESISCTPNWEKVEVACQTIEGQRMIACMKEDF